MKSSEYWQKRFQLIEEMNNKSAKNTIQTVTPAFDKAQAQIEKEINAWYGRFAKNNEITLQEAKKLLNTRELKEFRWDVQEYIKYGRQNAIDQQWMKELENASARFHISRLEALKIRTQNAAEQAFGNELDQLDQMAARMYMDDYYHTAYEIQRGIGVGWDVGQIDQNKLNKIINKPWTTDKQTFSDRIWKSKTQLIDSLHTEFTQMCILGKSPDEAIKNIEKRMNVSKNQAGRLVMTEATYFSSVAQKDCFNDLDVERYEIVATLDSKTSETCQQMDGKVFKMSDFQAGVTAPPFHVWCRSCTCPYFEDNDDGMRAARDVDGKTYYVPANMKYQDWKDHFVDKTKDPADWLKPATVDDIVEAVKKFVPAKTIQEAEEYAKNFAENVSYKGLSLENANIINERITELFDKYPLQKLDDITQRGAKAVMSANWHSLNIDGKKLGKTLNDVHGNFLASQEQMKKSIATMLSRWSGKKLPFAIQKNVEKLQNKLRFNRFAISDLYENKVAMTVTHEFGHIIADQFFGQLNHERANPNFATNWVLRKTSDKVNDTFRKAFDVGDIYKISDYGSTNSHEFFAECFTMYEHGEKLPDYIEEMMKEVLSNGRL